MGFIGRLVPEKGCQELVHALSRLGPAAPFLAVWGNGPLEGTISKSLAAGEISGSYGGVLDASRVPDALGCCDILVIPSRSAPDWQEQFGRVAVEAMLSGCAVIAYASGALPEVVGDGGVLVEEGDLAALSAEIDRLTRDPAAREDAAVRGRARALEHFHPSVLARRLVSFWDEVLE